jgi:hypothetical protein
MMSPIKELVSAEKLANEETNIKPYRLIEKKESLELEEIGPNISIE